MAAVEYTVRCKLPSGGDVVVEGRKRSTVDDIKKEVLVKGLGPASLKDKGDYWLCHEDNVLRVEFKRLTDAADSIGAAMTSSGGGAKPELAFELLTKDQAADVETGKKPSAADVDPSLAAIVSEGGGSSSPSLLKRPSTRGVVMSRSTTAGVPPQRGNDSPPRVVPAKRQSVKGGADTLSPAASGSGSRFSAGGDSAALAAALARAEAAEAEVASLKAQLAAARAGSGGEDKAVAEARRAFEAEAKEEQERIGELEKEVAKLQKEHAEAVHAEEAAAAKAKADEDTATAAAASKAKADEEAAAAAAAAAKSQADEEAAAAAAKSKAADEEAAAKAQADEEAAAAAKAEEDKKNAAAAAAAAAAEADEASKKSAADAEAAAAKSKADEEEAAASAAKAHADEDDGKAAAAAAATPAIVVPSLSSSTASLPSAHAGEGGGSQISHGSRGFQPGSTQPSSSPRPFKSGGVTFHDRGQVMDAISNIFTSRALSGWVLVSYTGAAELELTGTHDGDVSTLKDYLKDDQIQYAIARIKESEDAEDLKTRDVFIAWQGKNVKTIEKGKKKSHLGDVQQLLKPYHVTLYAVNRDAITAGRVRAERNQGVLE